MQMLWQMPDDTYAPRVLAHMPPDLYTDGGFGPNRRVRVDVGQTSFFAGREFRTFQRFNLAANGNLLIKANVPINTILFGLAAELTFGEIEMITLVGGVESGNFNAFLPILPRNTMSSRPTPFYTPVVTLATGGVLTGGTELDVVPGKTAGNTNQASSVGAETGDERGVGASTYYLRIVNLSGSDAARGVFRARWEERP